MLREAFKDGQLQPYAWPGGYPLLALTDDCESLCAQCVNDPTNPVHVLGEPDGWKIIDVWVHYEGPTEICVHCGRAVESAYGDPDA